MEDPSVEGPICRLVEAPMITGKKPTADDNDPLQPLHGTTIDLTLVDQGSISPWRFRAFSGVSTS